MRTFKLQASFKLDLAIAPDLISPTDGAGLLQLNIALWSRLRGNKRGRTPGIIRFTSLSLSLSPVNNHGDEGL